MFNAAQFLSIFRGTFGTVQEPARSKVLRYFCHIFSRMNSRLVGYS